MKAVENSIVGVILVVRKRIKFLLMQMRLPITGVTVMLVYASVIISMLCASCSNANGQTAVSGNENKDFRAYEIYAGSIGKGVPKLAQERMKKIEALVAAEQSRINLHYRSKMIGLEGERQLCLVLPTRANGQALLDQLRTLIEEVPLLSIKAATCSIIWSE